MKKALLLLFVVLAVGWGAVEMRDPPMKVRPSPEERRAEEKREVLQCLEGPFKEKERKASCRRRLAEIERAEKHFEESKDWVSRWLQEAKEEIAGRPLTKETAEAYEVLTRYSIRLDMDSCAEYMDTLKELSKYTDVKGPLFSCYDHLGDEYNALLASIQLEEALYPYEPERKDSILTHCRVFFSSDYYKSYGFLKRKLVDRKLKKLCPKKTWE